MLDKYSALTETGTWDLVPKPTGVNIVNCMWLFRHKFNAKDDLERHKARLVCDDRSEVKGVDCDETFSPVVKPATIRTILSVDGIGYVRILSHLRTGFPMTDLGPLNYFLGIIVTHTPSYLFLSQQKYAQEILERVGMSSCKPAATPVDTQSKPSVESGPQVHDPTLYRCLAGASQYLTFTRPNIAYAIQQVCLFMHDPTEAHYDALKRILQYI
ncbi:uncharacterized protein LOC110734919 [Chenopodium quinoa]|uniref:uncharacterized protein LOC110734919 n=1 Tax=Chenopodium quinoa TaxID=63459 RepID=UPI000B78D0E4|nr:uncharacterized protein LOC110734919 [Chenopodium quinoa]